MRETLINRPGLEELITLIKKDIKEIQSQTNQYTKQEVDALLNYKQNTLIPGKDIFITGDVIDNEHNFFTNQEIQDVWDIIMDDNY